MASRKRNHATYEAINEDDDDVFLYKDGVKVPENVTHIRFDPSVRNISAGAFSDCRDLVEVELNAGLLTIENCAFAHCISLVRIKIPHNVTYIPCNLFVGCTSLIDVELSEALLTIGGSAFINCSSLYSIKIPPLITNISPGTFSGCSSLREIELSENLQSIRQDAFNHCSSLIRIKIPPKVTSIGDRAFKNCTSLTDVELSDALETLDAGAFMYCSALYSIKIPPRITIICNETFFGCTSLKIAVLNEGIRRIDEDAFGECSTLFGITIPSTVTSINENAFKGSTLLRNVYISPTSNLTQEIFEQSFGILNDHYTLDEISVSLDEMRRRFDELPLHRYSYDYHSFHEDQRLDGLKQQVARLPAHGLQQDCLGMTPLHILACSSGEHRVEVYKFMIEKYPNALLIKDRWDDIPLDYALYAEASMEVIHFLFKTHRQMWGMLPFNFGREIEILSQDEGISAEFLRNVIQAQRIHFPDLRVDWHYFVNEIITNYLHNMPSDVGKFRVLVEASVSSRYICMSEEHRSIVDARVCEIRKEIMSIVEDNQFNVDLVNVDLVSQYNEEIRDLVTNYAQLHIKHLLEATTILELALWKAIIFRLRDTNQELTPGECRADASRCAEVVIKLVLTFL